LTKSMDNDINCLTVSYIEVLWISSRVELDEKHCPGKQIR
jgi:hypothetical protein